MKFEYAPGATPLDPDEAAGLIPTHISTQGDLNVWEEANIVDGAQWALKQRKHDLLNEGFVRDLHKKMFDKTWTWAGTFRISNKNIGGDWKEVGVNLRHLLDDAKHQIDQKTYESDELVVRFHHRLVYIHAFPNGNGRHARLMTDELILRLGRPAFSWGAGSLAAGGAVRQAYIDALKAADNDDIGPLLTFARQ